MTSTSHRLPQLTSLGALAAIGAVVLGGCSPGPRERTMASREAVIASQEGSTAIVYFSVHEDLPRSSVTQPIVTTASSEWLHGR